MKASSQASNLRQAASWRCDMRNDVSDARLPTSRAVSSGTAGPVSTPGWNGGKVL